MTRLTAALLLAGLTLGAAPAAAQRLEGRDEKERHHAHQKPNKRTPPSKSVAFAGPQPRREAVLRRLQPQPPAQAVPRRIIPLPRPKPIKQPEKIIRDFHEARPPDLDDKGHVIDAKPSPRAPDHAGIINNNAVIENITINRDIEV